MRNTNASCDVRHQCFNEVKAPLQGKMSARRRHTETEIGALADHFRQSWSDGQLIKSWLRDHADEIRDLVKREDWAWTNIGKALKYAGICYRTGNQWSGENLRKEVIKACLLRESKKSSTNKAPPLESGELEFKIIRAKSPPERAAPPETFPISFKQ